MRRPSIATVIALVAAATACGPEHGTGTRTPSASASASAGEAVDGAGTPAKPIDPATVPSVTAVDTSGGERLVSITRAGAATAEIRVVVRAGSADDGDHAGTARTVARALVVAYKTLATDGRAAADLAARVSPNATTFSFRSAPDGVAPTLKAIAAAFAKTALDAAETRAAAQRVVEDVKAERGDLAAIGPRLVQRDLFVAPIGRHPYSVTLLSAEEIGRVDAKAASAFLSTFFVASNITVVAVSATDAPALRALVEDAMASVRKGDARPADVDKPEGRPRPMKVMLVDAPKQDPVLVTLGRFGPTASQDTDTKTRIFGAVLRDRLARQAVDKARLEVAPLRQAPVLTLLRVELAPPAAPDAIKKLHDVLEGWSAPSADELVSAKNAVVGELLRTIDPPSAFADALALGAAVDAPENALEARSLEITVAEAADVGVTGTAILGHDGVLVVVGDAKTLAPALTVFGEVDVLDPAADFARVRSVAP
jgi:zinc protease